jgi:hypothetical protein
MWSIRMLKLEKLGMLPANRHWSMVQLTKAVSAESDAGMEPVKPFACNASAVNATSDPSDDGSVP